MESSKFHVLKVLDESTTDLEHDPINIKKWSSVACDLIHIFGEWKLKDLTCKNINTEMKKQIDHLHVGEKMDILMKIEIPNNISKAFSILEKYGKILQLPSITYIHVLVIRLNKEIQLLKDVPDLDNVVEWKNFISIMNKNTIMTSTPISSPMSQFSTTRKLLPLASPSSISCISDGLNESLNTSKFQKDTVELPTKISCQKITTESELHIAVKNGVDCRFSLSSVVENGLMTGYIYILTDYI
uniref:Ras-associating domain-containing protein n=1 Tax=Strongyloides papillosus TaxID=174720 RepID=A0A0N5BQ44_STREA